MLELLLVQTEATPLEAASGSNCCVSTPLKLTFTRDMHSFPSPGEKAKKGAGSQALKA